MSIIKQKNQRVAIFIDAQNLYHSAKSLYKTNVNFKNILEDTLAGRDLVRAIAYVIKTELGEEKNFFQALKKAGIETKSKDLQIFVGGAKKGDWDVGITVDTIRLSQKVDAVVIISGDGDFIPLVEYLKFNSGCQVEVATFASSASAGLVEVADDFFDLSEDLDRYLIKKYWMKKDHFTNQYNKDKNEIDKNDLEMNGLDEETPEMVAERVMSKRGLKQGNDIKKKNNKIVKNATEVEIKRVPKSEMINQTKKIKPKKLPVPKKIIKKVVVTDPKKKVFKTLKKNVKKVIKKKIKKSKSF